MTDLFDKVLHYCGRKGDNLFLINVGAMDGILFDEDDVKKDEVVTEIVIDDI